MNVVFFISVMQVKVFRARLPLRTLLGVALILTVE